MIESIWSWAAWFTSNAAQGALELFGLGLSALAIGFGARVGWSYADDLIRRSDRGEGRG